MAKKRERLEVIYDILLAIREHRNCIKPTRLLHSSNLSPQMFKDYKAELLEKKFMEFTDDGSGKQCFALTKKGFHFLEEYVKMQEFIENFGL